MLATPGHGASTQVRVRVPGAGGSEASRLRQMAKKAATCQGAGQCQEPRALCPASRAARCSSWRADCRTWPRSLHCHWPPGSFHSFSSNQIPTLSIFSFKNKNAWQAVLYRSTVLLFLVTQHAEDKAGTDSGGNSTRRLSVHPIRASWAMDSGRSASGSRPVQNRGPFELLVCVLKPVMSAT